MARMSKAGPLHGSITVLTHISASYYTALYQPSLKLEVGKQVGTS